jgi:hypothetical protein
MYSEMYSEFENEAISMIDRAQPLPPFADSMTEAKSSTRSLRSFE